MPGFRNIFQALGVALVAVMLVLGGCKPAARPSGKLVVVSTIFAYYDAARAIVGEDGEAVILLQPGQSPHEYSVTGADKEKVSYAKLVIMNGLGIDEWVTKITPDETKVLSLGEELQKIQTREETLADGNGDKDKQGPITNPHVWLDPLNQVRAAERIAEELGKIDPSHKAGFDQRAAAYVAEIRKLDAEFQAATKTFKHREFVGFHSAYDYLARRYGLVQAAAIEEVGAGGMNPAQVQHVIKLIKERKIPVVFTETAFDSSQAQTVIQATGVKIGILQPLETYDNRADTYVGLMRKNLAELKKAME